MIFTGYDASLNVQIHPKLSREQIDEAYKYGMRYAQAAWNARQNIVYKPSKMLTKTVYRDTVGVAGKGYCLLHDIVERGQPYSPRTLDGLLKAALHVQLGHDRDKIDRFMQPTNKPGTLAAQEAVNAASAVSLVVNFLMAYRSDGRSYVSQAGIQFAGVESWLRHLRVLR